MKDTKLIIPLGKPEFLCLEKFGEFIAFGLYKARISGHDERLFLINPKMWYTYIDIKSALARGYTVELVSDNDCNHVYYSSENRETGYYLFRGFVDLLYPLKRRNPVAKRILNMLWGALSQKVKVYESESVDFEDTFDFLDVCEDENESEFLMTVDKYKLPWARCGVFITAMGRSRLADFIAPFVDTVCRLHTDSAITTCGTIFKLDLELGGWKLEDSGVFDIQSLNKVVKII